MMLIGLVWAAFAPLLLLAAALLLRRTLFARLDKRRGWPLAALVVAVPVALLWWSDRRDFIAVCDDQGLPRIAAKARVDGFFLDSGAANSFGMRYLQDEGFKWIEAPSIYRRGAFVRYEKDGAGSVRTVEIDVLQARYAVREVFSQPYHHTGLSRTEVVDRQTGQVLASAGSASFDGGRAKWVLGAWGSGDCPSALRDPQRFSDYYHLARNTLR